MLKLRRKLYLVLTFLKNRIMMIKWLEMEDHNVMSLSGSTLFSKNVISPEGMKEI